MRTLILGQLIWLALTSISCQGLGGGSSSSSSSSGSSSDGVAGNEGGSEPINAEEEKAYKRAILKCYKTGGSRVVKIEGQLMCF